MKKLLSLLSVLTISGTAIPTTISASPYQKKEDLNEINNLLINNNLKNLNRIKRQNNRNIMNELTKYINSKLDKLNSESTFHRQWANIPKIIDFYVYPKRNTNSEATFSNTTHSEWKLIQSFQSSVYNYDPNSTIEKSSDIVSKKFTTTHTVSIADTKEISGEVPINFVISKFSLKFAKTETVTDTITTATNAQTNPVKIMVKPLHKANVQVEILSRKKIDNYLLSFEIDPDSWFKVIYGYDHMVPISENFNLKDFIINMENFNANSNKTKNILNCGITLKNNKIYINYIPLSEEITEYDFKTNILDQTRI